MNMEFSLHYTRCPECVAGECVKNGIVRGVQRYKCRTCGYNFVTQPKNRASRSFKYDQVVCLFQGLALSSDVPLASVERWLLEAQEHHDWFLRRIAEYGVATYYLAGRKGDQRARNKTQRMELGRAAIDSAFAAYEAALGRDPNKYLSSVQFAKILDYMKMTSWSELDDVITEYLSKPNITRWTSVAAT